MTTQEQVEKLFIQMVKAEMAISGNDWNQSKVVVKEWIKQKGLM
jgi:hypothetical protein